MLIENEFGQIGIDGGFLKESGINITEMNSGCICCSLVGDFGTALKDVIEQFAPDRILIEPSGVGKLSDVVAAVKRVEGTEICGTVTVIDASKCRIYLKNFKEFYENQIKYAGTIILSRTGNISQDKLDQAIALIREINDHSQIITTPWDELSGVQILKAIEEPLTAADMAAALLEAEEHEHHHHHEHGEDCECEECRHTTITMTMTMTMTMSTSITTITTTMMTTMMTNMNTTIITIMTTSMSIITIMLTRFSIPSDSRHPSVSQKLRSRML